MSLRRMGSMGWIAGATVLAVALTGCGKSQPSRPAAGVWLTSLDAALADAKAHHRPILLDFYTDW